MASHELATVGMNMTKIEVSWAYQNDVLPLWDMVNFALGLVKPDGPSHRN